MRKSRPRDAQRTLSFQGMKMRWKKMKEMKRK